MVYNMTLFSQAENFVKFCPNNFLAAGGKKSHNVVNFPKYNIYLDTRWKICENLKNKRIRLDWMSGFQTDMIRS